MLSAHITSFLNFINAQLEETSRGVTSSHHFHNVQCGIENILCLLECNDDATSHPADAPRWYPGGTVALLLREADQRGIDDRALHAGPAVDTPHSVEFSNAQLSPARIRALNDQLRQHLTGGMAIITPGVAALGPEAVERIVKTIAVLVI